MFGNVLTAMVTPFDEQLRVNYAAVAKLAQYLAENGTDGIVVAGTTGESPTLTKDEKLNLFKEVKQAVGDSCKVIAGVGTYSTRETIELTQKVTDLKLDGIMVVVPYYNKPSQQGLYEHFRAVAESTDLPIMLYNIPGRTGVNLQPETVVKLAEIPNILSLKEAAGSMDQVSELKSSLPSSFTIYSGDDSLTLPMLALGCSGVVSVASHIVGKQIKQMIESYLKGDIKKSLEWHLKLYPIFKGIFVTSNPAPIKFFLNEIGLNVGGYRPPLVGPTPKEQEFLRNLLKSFNYFQL